MGARFLAATFVALLLLGCASVPPEDAELDRTLKHFATKPDVAGVYIYCDEWMGTLPRSNVAIDGRPLGQIATSTYLYTELPAGPHRISATAGNTDALWLDAEAGHNYFVWHEVKFGWFYPDVQLHLVSQAQSMAGIATTRVAQPTYREEDLDALKRRAVAAAIIAPILGALPAATAGGTGIGIGTFMH